MKNLNAIIATQHAGIESWVSQDEHKALYLLAFGKSICVEVGTYKGGSTRVLCNSIKDKVYSIDWFKGEPYAKDLSPWKDSKETFIENTKKWLGNKLELLDMDSTEASKLLQKRGVVADIIWLDCDHSYEGTMRDIENYLPLLKPGGILCGHDYSPNVWDGVVKAVDEVFPDARRIETIWFWCNENSFS